MSLAQEAVALAGDELERVVREHEANSIDRVISTCYKLIRSIEQTTRDEQKLNAISREAIARTLREIADRAFTAGWTAKDLTRIQRAQILDILLSVADLAARAR